MAVDIREIEQFLYEEARIMDEHCYDDWLNLWTEDALYWVPCNADEYDPELHLSIIYDNAEQRGFRIARLKSGAAYAQDPQSRMRRIIGNVQVRDDDGNEITVESNFNLTHLRRSTFEIYTAHQVHKLRRVEGGWKIAYRKVMLLQNDEFLNNVSFLL